MSTTISVLFQNPDC